MEDSPLLPTAFLEINEFGRFIEAMSGLPVFEHGCESVFSRSIVVFPSCGKLVVEFYCFLKLAVVGWIRWFAQMEVGI